MAPEDTPEFAVVELFEEGGDDAPPLDLHEGDVEVHGIFDIFRGEDGSMFNIEFFVDEDRTHILEVNPRISQEHSHLMDWVDDSTNLEVMAQAALGQLPKLEPLEGPSSIAGKFSVREWEDAIVDSVPDRERLADIEERFAPCVIQVMVKEGDRLSEMPDQEPYSFIVAEVHLGAGDLEELCTQYQDIIDELPLEFRPPS